MKIAVIGPRGLGIEGGIEAYCRYVYPRMLDQGHSISLFTRSRYGEDDRWADMDLRPLASVPLHGLETLSYGLLATWQVVRHERPDVVHLHSVGLGLVAPLLRLGGYAVVLRHVGADWQRPKWGILGQNLLKLAERSAGRFADVVVCLNETIAQDFMANARPRAKVEIICNGIPKPRTGHSGALPAGLVPGRYILSASRISEEKGIITLIEAFRRSRLADRGYRLAIAGEASGRDSFRTKTRRLSARVPGVTMLGQVDPDRLSLLFHEAAAFVNASTHEGMSFSILEAMSTGCRSLLSDISANRDIGREHATYFPPGNVNMLARALREVSEGTRDRMAASRQRDAILRRHDLEGVARETLAALSHAIDLRRQGRGHSAVSE